MAAVGHTQHNWDGVSATGNLEGLEFEVEVENTRLSLLAQEDTDHDRQITVNDSGPKRFHLRAINNSEVEINGTYRLSNLLQELTLASRASQKIATVLGSRIVENPVDRLHRMISGTFWDTLTRRLDNANINILDQKANSGKASRLYVPHGLHNQLEYYNKVSLMHPKLQLEVLELPQMPISREYWRGLRTRPGLLALDLQTHESTLRGSAYVVPGGRFNEFYYWDSHFSAIGLLEANRIELVCNIVDNMRFLVDYYGLIPNANRTYYLQRSQPPFLTDLVIRTYRKMTSVGMATADEFLQKGILSAIKEYFNVWMAGARFDPATHLSCYSGEGEGIPPEVEPGHFDWILHGVAKKEGISIRELSEKYNSGLYKNPELDEFFRHDRAVRESGHDTSYRVEGQAADLATIDLNALLYKYETDIAWAIQYKFNDALVTPDGKTHTSSYWTDRANARCAAITKFLWNEATGTFHDYNTATKKQTPFQSVTAFYALWSGLATQAQADRLVQEVLPRFEEVGGAVSTLKKPDIQDLPHAHLMRPHAQQWDYPCGWAPHQMLLWDGLKRYGFHAEATRLAYRWLYLLTRIAVDFNGRITERYDVTRLENVSGADKVEYGNQGVDFEGVNTEGFGWSNASYQYGLSVIGEDMVPFLRNGVPWSDEMRAVAAASSKTKM